MRPAEELAQLWAAEELDPSAIDDLPTSAWKTYQLVYFLDKILQKSPLPPGEKEWAAPSGLGQMPCASWVAGDGSLRRGQVCVGLECPPAPQAGKSEGRQVLGPYRAVSLHPHRDAFPSSPLPCEPRAAEPGPQPLTQPTGGVGVWPCLAPALQHECPVAA